LRSTGDEIAAQAFDENLKLMTPDRAELAFPGVAKLSAEGGIRTRTGQMSQRILSALVTVPQCADTFAGVHRQRAFHI